jgi:hypothetical protein
MQYLRLDTSTAGRGRPGEFHDRSHISIPGLSLAAAPLVVPLRASVQAAGRQAGNLASVHYQDVYPAATEKFVGEVGTADFEEFHVTDV